MDLLESTYPIRHISQIWTRYPFNYNHVTYEVTWSYPKCSDMYHTLYKEQKPEFYIDMQKKILTHFYTSLEASPILYYRLSMDHPFIDSYVCHIEHRAIEPILVQESDPPIRSRLPPILPLYREGVLQNRSDICIATNYIVCIQYIHTNELGPPCYKVCWAKNKTWRRPTTQTASDIVALIQLHRLSGRWNIKEGSHPVLCILEQY